MAGKKFNLQFMKQEGASNWITSIKGGVKLDKKTEGLLLNQAIEYFKANKTLITHAKN
jgi:hypothetical protein